MALPAGEAVAGAAARQVYLYYLATTTLPALASNYQAHRALGGPVHLLFEVFLVKGPVFSLWFIPPLLFSLAVTYFFERRGWFAALCGLAALGFGVAQLASGSLCALLDGAGHPLTWTSARHAPLLAQLVANYLGIGFPAVVTGAWVARHEARFQRLPTGRVAACGALLLAAEIGFLTSSAKAAHGHLLGLSMAPISLLLFHGVLHLRAPGIRTYQALINRFSMVVFFLHPFLIVVNCWPFGWVPFRLSAGQALVCVLLTLPETLLLTLLLTTLHQRPRPALVPSAPVPEPVITQEEAS